MELLQRVKVPEIFSLKNLQPGTRGLSVYLLQTHQNLIIWIIYLKECIEIYDLHSGLLIGE